MIETTPIAQLAERCREENARFQRVKQSNPIYCFELFQRALIQNLDEAWQALIPQYEGLVTHWAYEYGARDLDEDPAAFVNEAFTRMWQYGRKAETIAKLDTLSKYLSYLKKCVWSAVEDYRQRQQAAILVDDWGPLEPFLAQGEGPEGPVILQASQTAIRQLLEGTVQDEKERVVARLSWVYDLTPRQIYADAADRFKSVEEVRQIKKNILKRLKRKALDDLAEI